MTMNFFARCVLAGSVAACALAFAADAASAAKRHAAVRVPQGACKVSAGFIASGQACTSAPNQYGMSRINWCSYGSLTPGIWCGGALCPATKC